MCVYISTFKEPTVAKYTLSSDSIPLHYLLSVSIKFLLLHKLFGCVVRYESINALADNSNFGENYYLNVYLVF